MAAKVDRVDQVYFDSVIRPMLAEGGVEMIGEINDGSEARFPLRRGRLADAD